MSQREVAELAAFEAEVPVADVGEQAKAQARLAAMRGLLDGHAKQFVEAAVQFHIGRSGAQPYAGATVQDHSLGMHPFSNECASLQQRMR